MKEGPILFSAPMVRALLDGSKTQTRRVLPSMVTLGRPEYPGKRDRQGYSRVNWLDTTEGIEAAVRECKYGQPGDLLWVREAFARIDGQTLPWIETDYRATYQHGDRLGDTLGIKKRWKPSIHMPRHASRITLEVTGVRVERLQDISEADALAEGIEPFTDFQKSGHWRRYDKGTLNGYVSNPVESYASLWESINGPGSWDANPWVWVICFKKWEKAA